MSEDDSRSLADTEQAAAITPAQLVFDDFDKAVTVVARRLGFPGPEWIGAVIRANLRQHAARVLLGKYVGAFVWVYRARTVGLRPVCKP